MGDYTGTGKAYLKQEVLSSTISGYAFPARVWLRSDLSEGTACNAKFVAMPDTAYIINIYDDRGAL